VATKVSTRDLARLGLDPRGTVHWNLAPAALLEHAIRRAEGVLTGDGSFAALTRPHTGRSPNDKFVVREPESEGRIWWGTVNVPFDPASYDLLRRDLLDHLSGLPELFARDVHAGADPAHRLNVRVINPNAWQNLFIHNMFIEPAADVIQDLAPGMVRVPARSSSSTSPSAQSSSAAPATPAR
jgi:phosphoenolpyruvate carboxykinase (ATP)